MLKKICFVVAFTAVTAVPLSAVASAELERPSVTAACTSTKNLYVCDDPYAANKSWKRCVRKLLKKDPGIHATAGWACSNYSERNPPPYAPFKHIDHNALNPIAPRR